MRSRSDNQNNDNRTPARRHEQDPRTRPGAAPPKAPGKGPARKLRLPAYVRHG